MPDRWTDFIQSCPTHTGVLMAVIVSIFTLLHERRMSLAKGVLEVILSGLLAHTICYGILAAHLDLHWLVVCGGVIGNLGPKGVRSLIVRIIERKGPTV